MLTCLKMSDPVGLTMAGKIDVMLLLGKGEESRLGCICAGVSLPDTRVFTWTRALICCSSKDKPKPNQVKVSPEHL